MHAVQGAAVVGSAHPVDPPPLELELEPDDELDEPELELLDPEDELVLDPQPPEELELVLEPLLELEPELELVLDPQLAPELELELVPLLDPELELDPLDELLALPSDPPSSPSPDVPSLK
jgi:hypothetical protein